MPRRTDPGLVDNMPHKSMTDAEWRNFVVDKFAEGDQRFGQIEERQERMRVALAENTKVTKLTDQKIDMLVDEVRGVGNARHLENLGRFKTIDGAIAAHAVQDESALLRLDVEMKKNTEVCQSIAGIVGFGRGTKSVVRWTITNVPALVSTLSSLIVLGLIVWWAFFHGPVPPFGH